MAGQLGHSGLTGRTEPNRALPIAVLWGLAVLLVFAYLWIEGGFGDAIGQYYLIPWSVLAGVIILSPSVYIYYRGKMDLFHPLVFGVWSYIFPAFILGGFILAFNSGNPYLMGFIENPRYELPLSLFYITVGYLSVVVGFYLPFSRFFAQKAGELFPDWDWSPDSVWLPGLVLMAIGVGFNIVGFIQGVLGFQRVDEIGIFDGLIFYLTSIYTIGNLLLWIAIFESKEKYGVYYGVLLLLIFMIPLKMGLAGNRGSLLSSVLPIAVAFWYSGRRLKWQHSVALAFLLLVSISVGIVYGTAFRNIKGSEARIDAGNYVGQIGETFDYISRRDISTLADESARTLFERLENLSSLAVVVSNYEKLEPYEASYGLKNNILNDLRTSLVPRFIWPDKPNTSDPRAYSELYFHYGENSFAITPFGDLLRNFGFFGIIFGMMLIGIYYRIIFSALIETDHPRIWKKMTYYPLLTVVSYEAFYATIAPSLVRILIILAFCISIIIFLAPRRERSGM